MSGFWKTLFNEVEPNNEQLEIDHITPTTIGDVVYSHIKGRGSAQIHELATRIEDEVKALYDIPSLADRGVAITVHEPANGKRNSEILYYPYKSDKAIIYINPKHEGFEHGSEHVHEIGHLLDLSHTTSTYSQQPFYEPIHADFVSRLPEHMRDDKYYLDPLESYTRLFQNWYEEINPNLKHLRQPEHLKDASHKLASVIYKEHWKTLNQHFISTYPEVYERSEQYKMVSSLTELSEDYATTI